MIEEKKVDDKKIKKDLIQVINKSEYTNTEEIEK